MTFTTMGLLFAGLANLVGGWCSIRLALSLERVNQVMALGAGFLLGGAFFTLLPAAMADSHQASLFIALGYLGMFVIHHYLHRREGEAQAGPSVQSAWLAVAGMLVHGFFDGAALGMAMHGGGRAGLMAFLALGLHKVSEGFSLAALVFTATRSSRSALLATGLVGLVTVAGSWLALVWAEGASVPHGPLVGLAAGSFLYVGCTDVIPAICKGGRSTFLVLLGTAMVYLLAMGGAVGHAH